MNQLRMHNLQLREQGVPLMWVEKNLKVLHHDQTHPQPIINDKWPENEYQDTLHDWDGRNE